MKSSTNEGLPIIPSGITSEPHDKESSYRFSETAWLSPKAIKEMEAMAARHLSGEQLQQTVRRIRRCRLYFARSLVKRWGEDMPECLR